jgi:acyl-coenzyme A synthetase/AMP-(fatty) acid ligase
LLDLFLDYAEIGSVAERTHSLRRAFTSGEKLAADSVDRFYRLFHDRPEVELVNLYGPTEAAIDVTHHLCRREPPYVDVPIGREIDNVRLYVFDEEMREVSAGEIGELYIAGVCLARGYHNDPAQTACKFLLHPAVPGERVYKSGDLVRRDPASRELHFLGRCDSQIKLRGQRIELGEIEQQIRDCAGVREAVVVADAERRSDHYIYSAVALAAGVGPEVLWKHLKAQLPEYMQPARLLVVDDMPRLTNGKVDRKSLQQRLTAASVGTVDLRAAGGIG